MKAASGPVALCYGTRPQIIKAAVLADALEDGAQVVTVDTGQHYDYELNGLLYEQLSVRAPTYCLDVGSADPVTQTATILQRAAAVLREIQPRAVLVIGDTNSTLGCALAAAQLRIPVAHIEAGLRSGDLRMAEELNRRMVDSFAGLLCAPSERAKVNLRRESAPGSVVVTGDVAYDALLRALSRVPPAHRVAELAGLAERPFVFATLHRAELVDDPDLLGAAMAGLGGVGMPVLFAAHPRTARALERLPSGGLPANLRLTPPLGYLEALAAIRAATVVVTDSGGLQREAYWLSRPCVTIRTETEWIETVLAEANCIVPPAQAAAQLPSVLAARLNPHRWDVTALGTGDAARRIRGALDRWLSRL